MQRFVAAAVSLCWITAALGQDTLWLGGGGDGILSPLDGTEAIDLSGSGSTCAATPPMPHGVIGAAGAKSLGRPVFCGGQDHLERFAGCYVFNKANNSWTTMVSMQTNRRDASIFQITDNDFMVLGGWNLRHQRTTEIYSSSTNVFTSGVLMPYRVDKACAAPINTTHFILTGGETELFIGSMTTQTVIYNAVNHEFYEVANFNTSRGLHGCGKVDTANGVEIVIAGGENDEDGVLDTVEIYNVDTDTWRPASSSLPRPITGAGSDQLGSSFILSGGHDDLDNTLVTIIEFEPATETWATRSEGIGGFFLGRFHHASVVVDDATLNVC